MEISSTVPIVECYTESTPSFCFNSFVVSWLTSPWTSLIHPISPTKILSLVFQEFLLSYWDILNPITYGTLLVFNHAEVQFDV